jgi:predicted ATPase/DNA-binding SARP family transcriptional activator
MEAISVRRTPSLCLSARTPTESRKETPLLELSLLGPFQASRDGRPVAGFAYDKVRALLAYLALEGDRPRRRETLAALLWPDQDERAARHSLSQALWSLRRALDDRDADFPLLLVTSDTVRLNPAAETRIDLVVFSDLLDACDTCSHRDPNRCRACARRLATAVDLYRSDLLEGFSLPDSVIFDEWLLGRREELRERQLRALDRLAAVLETRGDLEQAIACARRALALDPWREDAVRRLLRLLAWSGQRPAAIEQFERFRQRLDAELGVEPEAETLDLIARVRRGEERRPAGRVAGERRWELPVQVTGFVGRERELAELRGLLEGGDSRLITLTGPGGIGKTRLAIEAARAAGAQFADGVVFAPLAGLPSADLLPSAIGGLLGAPVQGSHDERESLLGWLTERELLLVLDNLEHLLDGVDLIGEALRRAPDLQLLVTSRERLNLAGEWVIEVGGLAVSDNPDSEGSSGSEELFIQRARQVRAGFMPDAAEQAAIARLCRLVEGMPLAIEIAAGWLAVLSCAGIVGEVERSVGFLATTRRDVEPRHRSVQAVFDRSWELLSEGEQRVFRRLSVFRGGFGRDAAERVAGASLPLLSALVAKSLLRRTATARYEMHELSRQHAAARLAEHPDEADLVRERHCVYFTDLLARRAGDLRGAGQDEALTEIETEIENVRAAWATAIEGELAGPIAGAAYGFWLFSEITGRNREMQDWLRRGVDLLAAGQTGEDAARRSLAYCRLLLLLAATYVRTGEHDRGDALAERGLEIIRDRGRPEDIALGLNFRAAFAHARLDLATEEALLRESIDQSARTTDRWVLPYSLNDLGMARLERGDVAEATRLCRESLAIFRAAGDQRGAAFALHNLGVVIARQGDHRQAEALLLETLEIRRRLRHSWGVAVTLIELGVVARGAGDRCLAGERFRDALAVSANIHSLPAVLRALTELADLLARDGEQERAARLLNDVLRHPSLAAADRLRAGDLLRPLDTPAPTAAVAASHDDPDEAIDRQTREILRRRAPEAAALV